MVSADYILFHCQEQSRSYKPSANADGNTKANSSFCQGIAMQFKPTNVSERKDDNSFTYSLVIKHI